MSLKNKIATDKSILTVPIKYFFYKFKNKYYDVNSLIKSTEINGDLIKVTLNDGTVLMNYASKIPAEIQFSDRIKYGNASKLNNIIDVDKFFFIYEIISELFVNKIHFKHFGVNEGDIVIDAGANIGGFTIQAAKKAGSKGKVIAFEPNKQNMKILKMNCDVNKLNNVIFIEKGLWSKKDTLEFFESHRPGEHSLIHTDEQHEKFNTSSTKIEVDTIDNILNELKLDKVNFLKMDIEGAEYEALKGAENSLLKQNDIKMIIEIHKADWGMTDTKITPMLKEHLFEILESGSAYRMPIFAKK